MPVEPYPLDPYKDPSNWPNGFGQLTNVSIFKDININFLYLPKNKPKLGEVIEVEDYISRTIANSCRINAT